MREADLLREDAVHRDVGVEAVGIFADQNGVRGGAEFRRHRSPDAGEIEDEVGGDRRAEAGGQIISGAGGVSVVAGGDVVEVGGGERVELGQRLG